MLDKTILKTTTAPPLITTPPEVGFQCVSSEVENLTKDYVKDFRAIEATTTERELSRARVNFLRARVDAGLAVTFYWVTAELDGVTRRINGQHSSTMLNEIEGEFPCGLRVLREHYKVNTLEDLALLFRQFDVRQSGRSPLDVSGVYQGLYPEIAGLDRKLAKLAIDGFVWYQRNVEKVPMPVGDDVYTSFNDKGLWPLIRWLNELLAGRCSEIKHAPVIAAIVGTFMKNESAAKAFWQDVKNFSGEGEETSPSVMLDTWLLAVEADKIESPGAAHLYQGCIYAWNAYRSDKPVTAIRSEIKKNFFGVME